MKIEMMVLGSLATNAFLVASEKNRCAVIDPAAEPEKIMARLDEKGWTPAMILLTHAHYDHIGAVKELQAHYHIPVMMSAADHELIQNPKLLYGDKFLFRVAGKDFVADRLLADEEEIELDELRMQVLATPGHSAGSVCYLCGNKLFSGDTLFAGSVGRCDMYSGDMATILQSVQRLAALPGDYDVFPGHGPASTLAEERAFNPYVNGSYANQI